MSTARRLPHALVAAALLHTALVASAHAGSIEDLPKLVVRGEAELRKPADQMRLKVGVVTADNEPSQALNDNSKLMNAVVTAIKDAGLSQDELQTGRFSISPKYTRRTRQDGPDWVPKIIGYEVRNTILVRTKQLDLAGALIEAANKAGANTVDVVGFELSDPHRYRAEVLRAATQNAIADARVLADAASVKLVGVLSISVDHIPAPMREMGARFAMADSAAVAAPPIIPGGVTIRAGVSIVYEIAPEDED